jgi:transposase InsO family protein
MRRLGLHGVMRGKVVRTTVGESKAPCPLDPVIRQFRAERPNQHWVSDFTSVSTWQGPRALRMGNMDVELEACPVEYGHAQDDQLAQASGVTVSLPTAVSIRSHPAAMGSLFNNTW